MNWNRALVTAAIAFVTGALACTPRPQVPRAEGVSVSEQAPPADQPSTTIDVRGMRWAWAFRHETHQVSGVLHAPVGRWVHLTFETLDVAHRFEIPELGLVVDVEPGVTSERWLRVEQPSTFRTVCSVSCPAGGRDFTAEVRFVPQGEYDALLAAGGRPAGYSDARWGQDLIRSSGCVACHARQTPSPVGPSLDAMWGSTRTLADRSSLTTEGEDGLAYLRESITDPRARLVQGFGVVMPAYTLNPQQLDALVAYVRCAAPDACGQLPECDGLDLCGTP